MGLGIVFAIRRAITNGAKGLYKKALAADMLDVEKHYGAPAAFFVAARPKEGDKKSDDGEQAEEVVGYVGLGRLPLLYSFCFVVFPVGRMLTRFAQNTSPTRKRILQRCGG
jgi:peptidoglycan/xylan/chitin deacetylase (PgdA/CDA1 family)